MEIGLYHVKTLPVGTECESHPWASLGHDVESD